MQMTWQSESEHREVRTLDVKVVKPGALPAQMMGAAVNEIVHGLLWDRYANTSAIRFR